MASNTSEKRGKHAKHAKVEVPSIEEKPKHGKISDEILFDDDEETGFFSQETTVLSPVSDGEEAKVLAADATVALETLSDGEEDDGIDDVAFASVAPAAVEQPKQPKDRTKLKKGLAIGFGSVFGLLLIIYLVGVFVFADRLYPNTKFGDLDVSMQTSAELRDTLNNRVEGYSLSVKNKNGFACTISSSDIGLAVDGNVTLSQMVPNRTSLTWPIDIFQSHDISKNVDTSYNLAIVQSTISGAVQKYNETATLPVSATLAYNETKKAYEVVSEKAGTALDESAVIATVGDAIASLTTSVELGDDDLLKPAIKSDDSRIPAALAAAEKMSKADVIYTIGDAKIARVTPGVIATWITLDNECNAALDDTLLTEWATETAEPLNTVGSERTYTRPDGKVITVSGGDYGWEVDVDAFVAQVRADVAEGTTKESAIPTTMTGEGFTAVGGADWGARYIDVDLSEQYARFYDSTGALIWEADIVSGAPTNNHATPDGVYYIKAKESPSKLIGYLSNGQKDYETTVQYWMPFIGNDIGFHDATWQPSFGGTMYRDGYGSHGCINLSYADAQALYSIIEPNDVVVVHE